MDIKPRVMTRQEINGLREAGLDPTMRSDAAEREMSKISVEMIDYILDNIYPEHNFDNEPYNECAKLAADTYLMTMGRKDEIIKN